MRREVKLANHDRGRDRGDGSGESSPDQEGLCMRGVEMAEGKMLYFSSAQLGQQARK